MTRVSRRAFVAMLGAAAAWFGVRKRVVGAAPATPTLWIGHV